MFTVDGATTPAARDCDLVDPETGTGSLNEATVTPNIGDPVSDDACAPFPDPDITVEKDVLSNPTQPVQVGDGFQHTVTYTITVENEGEGPGTYALDDELAFDSSVTIDKVEVDSTDPVVDIDQDNGDPLNIVSNAALEPGESHTYTVVVTFTVPGSSMTEARNCALVDQETGTGTLNTATVTPNIGDESSDDACAPIPDPAIVTDKMVTAGPTFNDATDEYTMTYLVTVENTGDGPGTFDLVEDPEFGAGTTITKVEVDSADPVTDVEQANGDPFEVVTDSPIAAGATKTFTVVVTFTIDATTTSEARDCDLAAGEEGTGTLNNVLVTDNNGNTDQGSDCEELPGPGINVVKNLAEPPTQPVQIGDSFQYTVDYELVVSNTGDAPGTYDLDDEAQFGDGTTITAQSVSTSDGTVNGDFNDAVGNTSVADDVGIGVDETHTYDVTVTFTVDGAMSENARDCTFQDQEDGTGSFNEATVTPSIGDPSSDDACAPIPDSDISVDKTKVEGYEYDAPTGEYTATYNVVVSNTGDGPGTFDLVEEPTFGGGTTITKVEVDSADPVTDLEQANGDPIDVATDSPIAAGATKTFTVVVTFTIDATATSEARDCALQDGEEGTGSLNTVTITDQNDDTDTGEDCDPLPDPNISIEKDVSSDPSITVLGSDSWTVEYELTIRNTGDGPGTYELTDAPTFASGLLVTDQQATSTDITINGDFNDAVGNSTIATGVPIAAGETQVVTVLVTFDYTGSVAVEDRACGVEPGPGDATFNSATVFPAIGDPSTDDDCGDLPDPQVSIDKTALGNASNNGDGTWTILYLIDVTNAAAAGTGSYDLDDQVLPSPGVTVEDLSAENLEPGDIDVLASFGESSDDIVLGEQIEAGVTHTYRVTAVVSLDIEPNVTYVPCDGTEIAPGEGLYNTASITVDGVTIDDDACGDVPGDLEIEKSDGGATAIAGGSEFTYSLTVTNVGGIGTGSPVTVTDVLPAEFEWVSIADGCTQNGQTVTCDIDPTLVDENGESTTIELTARAPEGTDVSAEGYENLSFVDSPDDPAPEEPACPSNDRDTVGVDVTEQIVSVAVALVDEIMPGNPDNNVDCDETPVVDGDIEADKTDNVPDTDTVENGDQFEYSITVENVGSSPLNDVAFTDDLPASLSLVSVAAGAGWNCNDADPLACTYDDPNPIVLAPGETTTPVVLTVQVTNGALDQIDNTANATAVVRVEGDEKTVEDDDPEVTPIEPTLDVTGFEPTCVGDFPYIQYDIVAKGFAPSTNTATIEILDINNNVIDTLTNQPLSGQILWPGASLNPPDWPGWQLVNGVWVEDGTDQFLRDGLFFRVTVNPTATTTLVPYPAASEACADPDQTSADLQIEKTATNTEPEQGSSFNYDLLVTNNGPDLATELVVTDTVPNTLTVTGVSSDDFDCTRDGNSITCTRDQLAVNGTGLIVVAVDVPTSTTGVVNNVAEVDGRVPDPNPDNNTDDADVTVPTPAPLPPPPLPDQGVLPETGSNGIGDLMRMAGIVLIAGLALWLATNRKRRDELITN
ncbi:MAG: DUF11 domain-containing protein [Actinomycetota bacterium]